MNKEIDQIELIEKHIEKRLTNDEVDEFEKLASEDELFRKLYKEIETLIPAIENGGRESLVSYLKELDAKLPEIKDTPAGKPNQKARLIVWSTIAVACLIGVVFFVNTLPSNNSTNDTIYNCYYKPYNSLAISNDRSEGTTDPNRTNAFYEYAAGNYIQAIDQLEKLNKTGQDVETIFYLANSYMATGQITKAIEGFNIIESKESTFNDQAKWYLALCYLKINQLDIAKEKFNDLANYSNTYTTNAKEILSLTK